MFLSDADGKACRRRDVLDFGDVRLDVIVDGEGDKIVMLPSLGRTSEDFDDIAASLASKGYMVLRPQPRGSGESCGPMEDLTLRDFAKDIANVIEHYGGGKAVIVGHAFGNWVARMTAVHYPHLVKGVVIAAGADKDFPVWLSENIRKIAEPATTNDERLALLWETFFARGSDASVWLNGWYPQVRESQVSARKATDRNEWWSAGNAKILDLQASDDPFKKPENRYALRDELGSRVTVDVIPDASHALLPEQPEKVAEAIIKWMSQLDAG